MKNMLVISLIVSIIGILILLILSNSLQPEKINIKDINFQDLNKKIQTQGIITSIKTFQEQDFQIINIKQENYSIAVLVNQKTNLTKNQTIKVIGKITEYKEDLEIQAEKISLISLKLSWTIK